MKTLKNKIIMCVCAFALLFVYSSSAIAQEEEHNRDRDPQNTKVANEGMPRIEVGFRGMPVFSSFRMQTSAGLEIKGSPILGYGFEGLIGFNFNSHLELQAEVIYNSISRDYNEVDVNRKVNLRYVNVPFLYS